MGCDGGTIPRRDELVRVKKKPEQKDKDAERAFLWKCCAITQEALQQPIVACHLGKLYNKMSVIEALLDRGTLQEDFKHIRSLKDVKDLKLTKNPAYKDDTDTAKYICPVLGLEMSGKHRFIALWSCGCVFSERACKEINSQLCHKCGKPFNCKDKVVINGNEEDAIIMQENMIQRQADHKKKKQATTIKIEPNEATTSKRQNDGTLVGNGKKSKICETNTFSKLGNVIASGKVTKQEEIRKIQNDYSIAKDNKATDVYKSLFTSHKSEKEQDRAHWVTYNPFYN